MRRMAGIEREVITIPIPGHRVIRLIGRAGEMTYQLERRRL